jgi:hypothetical protein
MDWRKIAVAIDECLKDIYGRDLISGEGGQRKILDRAGGVAVVAFAVMA